ncbi:hypothetical protein ACH5RR_031927 [Cinchona calisaya]|uniref:Uncharacterized protein n=1 Tax=Cinchona calisaya TaxID=153742 RepID=A0ABD2YKW2_9GENT
MAAVEAELPFDIEQPILLFNSDPSRVKPVIIYDSQIGMEPPSSSFSEVHHFVPEWPNLDEERIGGSAKTIDHLLAAFLKGDNIEADACSNQEKAIRAAAG